jgi:hypothetical protein
MAFKRQDSDMLTLNETNTDQAPWLSVDLTTGDYAGQQVRAEYHICPNPACACKTIELILIAGAEQANTTIPMMLYFVDRTFEEDKRHKGEALVKAFIDNLTSDDWHLLFGLYVDSKEANTESVDLEKLVTYFPAKEIEETNCLIGIREILPYSDMITFKIDGEIIVADDKYCVNSHCDCETAGITFLWLDDPERCAKEAPTILLSYNKANRWSIEDANGCNKELIKRLANAISEEDRAALKQRHQKMRLLYQLYKRREGVDQLPVHIETTAGRNDPCPCGSGKKFKRCCLNKGPVLSPGIASRKKFM